MSFPIEQAEASGLIRVLGEVSVQLANAINEVVEGDRAKTIATVFVVRSRLDALYQGMIRDLVQRVVKSGKADPEDLDETTRRLLGV